MNKPTRSEIEHRAVEILLNLKETGSACQICKYRGDLSCCGEVSCSNALMESALEKAEKELTQILSPKQKIQLKNRLDELEKVTKHKYISFTYYNDIEDNKFVNLEYKYIQNEFRVDMIHVPFVSFADEVFESGKEYNIEELLND